MKISTLLGITALVACAQPAAPPRLEFEVASIHPSSAEEGSSSWNTAKGSLRITNKSLKQMIQIAYRLSDAQLEGGPKWMAADRFDVIAKPSGTANGEQLLAMLQGLLADRFKLAVHRETKEISGYSLIVVKGGLKVQPVPAGKSQTGIGDGRIEAKATGCDKLAELLSRVLGEPVANDTGVEGAYDFSLEWSRDEQNATGPSLFTVLQEKLGLKLESRKVPAEVIVVDGAEKPGDN